MEKELGIKQKKFWNRNRGASDQKTLKVYLQKLTIADWMTILLAMIFFAEFMSGKNYIRAISKLNTDQPVLVVISLFCIWAQIFSVVILILQLGYKFPLSANIITYIILPFSILNLSMFSFNAVSISGAALNSQKFNVRVWLYLAENILTCAIALLTTIRAKSYRITWKSALKLVAVAVGMAIVTCPPMR